MSRVLVIGAGITGVTTAYTLSRRGFDVTVIDRLPYAAMDTSFANGGQLSASNAEVWNQSGTLFKGIKWMLQKDAPLLLNPTPSWHKYSWLAEFVGAIRRYRDNTVATTRMAIEARRHLFDMAETEDIAFDLERRGILHVYYDRASFEVATRANRLMLEGGLERYAVTPDEIRSIEPSLTGQFYGGYYTPSDATGDIHKFTRGLAAACVRRGVQFKYGREVHSIDFSEGAPTLNLLPTGLSRGESERVPGDAVVVCGGVGSRRLAALCGDRLNVYPVKGYSITVHLDDAASQAAAPWVSLLDERAKIVTSRLGEDRFRVAGTAEFNGSNRDIRADRIEPLLRWVRQSFDVNTSRVVPWAGLRPMMPDMMPRVRRGKRPGVYYNTGHGHLGWTLSAATAHEIVETIYADSCRADAGSPNMRSNIRLNTKV
ncbi:D-amino acid dehydrogenase [Allopusillimonas ginsengisoli]|uniref:D-amino acid dehydrogenase n=1 Tax=Allopusillimonas ginsengisoli TaxID=453575 RepID=UPI00102136B2|nr:D-amino acid dehydrogenase [Allopusillimonas ginsengisoli]TEA70029.1 D-amino acid dehydrogenase [Allopusillimonas ginsengisoli]